MKNAKKAQVSMFVIVGVVLVLIISFAVWVFTSNLSFAQNVPEEVSFNAEVDKINLYVQSCVQGLGEEGLILLGKQGGLINLEDNYFEAGYADIRYAYNKEHTFPSLGMISSELSDYISRELAGFCIFENDTFYEITRHGRIHAEVYFTEDSTRIEAAWPLTMTAGADAKELREFKITLPVRMQKIHGAVESIIGNPGYINLEFTENKIDNMNLKWFLKGKDNRIGIVLDHDSKLRGESYKFMFAVKK